MKPLMMGYGAVGMTKSGQEAVPVVGKAYPYCYNNVPYNVLGADIIVINHGTNDMCSDSIIRRMKKMSCLYLLKDEFPTPIHPNRDNHNIVARNLAEVLKSYA